MGASIDFRRSVLNFNDELTTQLQHTPSGHLMLPGARRRPNKSTKQTNVIFGAVYAASLDFPLMNYHRATWRKFTSNCAIALSRRYRRCYLLRTLPSMWRKSLNYTRIATAKRACADRLLQMRRDGSPNIFWTLQFLLREKKWAVVTIQ